MTRSTTPRTNRPFAHIGAVLALTLVTVAGSTPASAVSAPKATKGRIRLKSDKKPIAAPVAVKAAKSNPTASGTSVPTSGPSVPQPMFWVYQANGALVGVDARQSVSNGANGKRVDVVSYTVSWGDGQTESKTTPDFQHTYQSLPGTFNVTLTIRDANNFSASTSTQLVLESASIPLPTLDASPVLGSSNLWQFRALFSAGTPQINKITYDFGDGTPPVEYYEWRSKQLALLPVSESLETTLATRLPDFTHNYSSPGTYTAKVTLTSDIGVTSVGTKIVVVGANGSVF